MKEIPTPYQVMEELAENISKVYPQKSEKTEGAIQFHLTHGDDKIDCYLKADLHDVMLYEGTIANPTVTLKSTLYHWLDLAAKRLNPAVGVMTGRLKFKGDTSFFSKVMSDSMFDVDVHQYADPVTDFEKNPCNHWKTPKSILVINSSPRARGGYTDFYLKSFLKGLEKSGAEPETIYLRKQKINRCTGCWHCWLSGTGDCIFNGQDDFEEIHEKFENADLIVFAFPLYTDGMPGALKDFFDRAVCRNHPYMVDGLYKTRHPRRRKKQQAAVVFSVCGFIEMENFNAVRSHLRQISHNEHIPIVAEIFRSGGMYLYNNPLLYKKMNEILQALERAGEEVFISGKVSKKNQKIIGQKLGKIADFQKESDYFWFEKIRNNEKTY